METASLVAELKLIVLLVCFTHGLVSLRRKWKSKKDALIGSQEEEKHWGYNQSGRPKWEDRSEGLGRGTAKETGKKTLMTAKAL